jgi:hypothetical protein
MDAPNGRDQLRVASGSRASLGILVAQARDVESYSRSARRSRCSIQFFMPRWRGPWRVRLPPAGIGDAGNAEGHPFALAAALRSLLVFAERIDCGLYSIEDMRPVNELRMVVR